MTKTISGTQFSSNISGSIKHQNKGEFELKGQQYLIGEDYNGYRLISNGVIDTKMERTYRKSTFI